MTDYYKLAKNEVAKLSFDGRKKIAVATVSDLAEFIHVGSDTLIHKSTRDLWRLSTDDNGNSAIERLFDEEEPLKDS